MKRVLFYVFNNEVVLRVVRVRYGGHEGSYHIFLFDEILLHILQTKL